MCNITTTTYITMDSTNYKINNVCIRLRNAVPNTNECQTRFSVVSSCNHIIDETLVLCINAEYPNYERKRIQKRYRLRGKIRQAMAEGMGTEDYEQFNLIHKRWILIEIIVVVK